MGRTWPSAEAISSTSTGASRAKWPSPGSAEPMRTQSRLRPSRSPAGDLIW